jgi:hypothetical protein
MQNKVTTRCNKSSIGLLQAISLLIAVTAVTGCSSLPETITGTGNHYPGYTSYDPCVRCGESWQKLPNQYMNALRTKERWDAEREGREIQNQIDISGPVEVRPPKVVIIE